MIRRLNTHHGMLTTFMRIRILLDHTRRFIERLLNSKAYRDGEALHSLSFPLALSDVACCWSEDVMSEGRDTDSR